MAAVTFSPRSRQDLIEIGDYIAKDSRANARRFVGNLMDQCKLVGHAPFGYATREDLAPGLGMAALGHYVVSFRVIETTVRIERVLHDARNFPPILQSDRKSE